MLIYAKPQMLHWGKDQFLLDYFIVRQLRTGGWEDKIAINCQHSILLSFIYSVELSVMIRNGGVTYDCFHGQGTLLGFRLVAIMNIQKCARALKIVSLTYNISYHFP